jgi:DNA-binding NtrC family response regulator
MEFIFRTLVEMKMDLEDLRSEFERYRGRHPELMGDLPLIDLDVEPIEISADTAAGTVPLHADPAPTIRLTPDMTMDDVEREAIRIALEEMRGNRRKAAERLGIGERTLYRKLKQFDLEP